MCGIFTIGHSVHRIDDFIDLLKSYQIDYVIDVRSDPHSKYAYEFNKENLKPAIEKNLLNYVHMGKYFGARREDMSLYSRKENGKRYLDFDKVRSSEDFLKGYESICRGVEKFNIAFMCAEKNPMDCHRAIMVSKAFTDHGYKVKHILEDGTIETQNQLDQELLNKYCPNRNQIDMFSSKKETDYLLEAYQKRNMEIGFCPDEVG
ncbi:MAG: DUF488 domain-containing protein [Alphaproteobacteria bacterium]|nr:DUF488 domain-containing protein [Alphaproteobacteria bacterium]